MSSKICRGNCDLWLSSLILCIWFGVVVLSRFVPIINFGMLTAVIGGHCGFVFGSLPKVIRKR